MVLPDQANPLEHSSLFSSTASVPTLCSPGSLECSFDPSPTDTLKPREGSFDPSPTDARKHALEKYLQKRSKRLQNCQRSRNRARPNVVDGHFKTQISAYKTQLNQSKTVCNSLRTALFDTSHEVARLRAELDYQRKLNSALLFRVASPSATPAPSPNTPRLSPSSTRLASTPQPIPQNRSSQLSTSPTFLTDLDLSAKKTELKKTDGPFLTKEELQQYLDSESQWEQEQRRHAFVREAEARYRRERGETKAEPSSPCQQPDGFVSNVELAGVELRKTNLPYSPTNLNEWDQHRLLAELQAKNAQCYQQVLDELLDLKSPKNLADSPSSDQFMFPMFELGQTSPKSERSYRWGGPPSDVYEPPNKIGNAMLPAFTTKLDFSSLPQNLRPVDVFGYDVEMPPFSPGSPMDQD